MNLESRWSNKHDMDSYVFADAHSLMKSFYFSLSILLSRGRKKKVQFSSPPKAPSQERYQLLEEEKLMEDNYQDFFFHKCTIVIVEESVHQKATLYCSGHTNSCMPYSTSCFHPFHTSFSSVIDIWRVGPQHYQPAFPPPLRYIFKERHEVM